MTTAIAVDGPPIALSGGPLGRIQDDAWEIGRRTASQARAVAEFAAARPASADRQPGERGCASAASRAARPQVLADVSEWAGQELAVALQLTQSAAMGLLTRSLTLVHRLPATLAALECGAIHLGHLWAFVERVAVIADPRVRARVEAELLGWMAGKCKTSAQLAERARVLVLRHDAVGAAQRLAATLRTRGVFGGPGREDGMAQLTAVLSVPEMRMCLDVLGRYADSIDDEDPAAVGADGLPVAPRTRAQKMADCLLDLILCPGENGLPLVSAYLTVVASVETLAGGDEPGEVDGQVVPAEMVRHLARALDLLPQETIVGPMTSGIPASAAAATSATQAANIPAPEAADAPNTPSTAAVAPATATSADAGDGSFNAAGAEPEVPSGPEEPLWPPGWDEEPDSFQLLYGQVEHSPGGVSEGEWLRLVAAWTQGGTTRWWAEPEDGDAWPTDPDLPADPDLGADVDDDLAAGADVSTDPPADAGWSADTGSRSAAGAGWAAADAAVWVASHALQRAQVEMMNARVEVRAAEWAACMAEQAHQTSVGALNTGRHTIEALAELHVGQREMIGSLLERTVGGGLADRPRVAVVDALSGTLLALTDARELRRLGTCGRDACARRKIACTHDMGGRPGLAPPGPTEGYRPGRELDRFVRARDRRCRFPGCRRRVPRGGQLDHDQRWPEGPTSAGNLAGYCIPHHRGKHQAPGWRHQLHPDGRLTVTTPTGLTTTTDPPPF